MLLSEQQKAVAEQQKIHAEQQRAAAEREKAATEQEKAQSERQQKFMEQMLEIVKATQTAKVEIDTTTGQPKASLSTKEVLIQSLRNKLETFDYNPEADGTFDVWYRRYEKIFTVDAAALDEKDKVSLLLYRLSNTVFARISQQSSIYGKSSPFDLDFEKVRELLDQTYGSQVTLFSSRYACMRAQKEPREDIMMYLDRVNDMCDRIKYKEMSLDHFKSLVFACGLKDAEDLEIQRHILTKLEEDPTIKLEDLRARVEAYLKMKKNLATVKEKPDATTMAVKSKRNDIKDHRKRKESSSTNSTEEKNRSGKSERKGKPNMPCTGCGGQHWKADCKHKDAECYKCGKRGHLSRVCATRPKKGEANVRTLMSKPRANVYGLRSSPTTTENHGSRGSR